MEIELKVLEIDPGQLRSQLLALGAEFLGREFQQNHMYDYPDRRLYEQQDGSYIRLRSRRWLDREQQEVLLTYKETVSRTTYKIAEETETLVSDFAAMEKFLQKMGLVRVRVDEKLRESYLFNGVHYELDEWAGLPPYLEIEADSEQKVAEGLAVLGYSLSDATPMSLREVLAKYKIKASELRFSDFGRKLE